MEKFKNIKVVCMLFMLIVTCSFFVNTCFAQSNLGSGFNEGIINDVESKGIESPFAPQMNKIWGTVMYVLQIASVAGVIITGLRYMFASAEQRANMKKATIYTIIGIVMVFAFSTFMSFMLESIGEVLQ